MENSVLLTGPNHRSLEDEAFARADELAGEDPGSVLYVTRVDSRAPTVEDRWAEAHRPLRLRTENLKGVVRDCYEALVGPRSICSGALAQRLAEYALDRVAGESDRLGTPPVSASLADAFGSRFSLFGDVGITDPETLAAELDATELDERIAATVTDAYAAYHDLREAHTPDWVRPGGEAFEAVTTADASLADLLPNVDAVVLSGYYEFRPVERAMVERLAEAFPVLALVPLQGHSSPSAAGVDAAASDALTAYDEMGLERERVAPEYGSRDLQRASAELYRTDPRDCSPDPDTLAWRELPNREREARFVARDVRRALADGADPDAITVVVPRLEAYREYLTEAFETYEVPHAVSAPRSLEDTLVGRVAEDLLALADDRPRAEDLTTLLSNPLVASFDADESAAVTAAVRRLDRPGLDPLFAELDPEVRARVEQLADEAAAIGGAGGSGAGLESAVANLRDLLADLGVPEAVESYASGTERRREERALSVLEDVLASCEKMADAPTPASEPAVLQRAVAGTPVRLGNSPSAGRVEVLGLLDAQMRALDSVYLVGLTGDDFPATSRRPAFFEAMTDAHPAMDPGDDRERARYRFGALLGNANSVTVTTPATEADAAAVVRSPVLDELRRVTGVEPETGADDRIGSREDLQRALAPRSDRREALDAAGRRGDLPADLTVRADRAMACAENRERDGLTGHDGLLDPETVEAVYPESARRPYSASRIEKYARCGFRFYASEVLGIEADDDLERAPTPLETGDLVHDVLERFFADLQDAPGEPVALDSEDRDREELEAHLLAVAQEEIESADLDYGGLFYRRWCESLLAGLGDAGDNPHFGGDRPHDADERGLLVRFLDAELDRDGPRPAWFERPFGEGLDGREDEREDEGDAQPVGEDAEVPPVEVELPSGESLPIRGYVDRIDVAEREDESDGGEGALDITVYDYKAGSTPSMTKTTGGTRFQLPVYLLAAEQLLAGEGEEEQDRRIGDLSATYYKVEPPNDVYTPWGIESKFDSQAELRRFLREVVPERLATIDGAISEGRFHTTLVAEGEAGCGYCDYREICGVRHHRKRDRVQRLQGGDPAYVPQRVRDESFAAAFGGESDD